MENKREVLVEVKNLKKYFQGAKGSIVKAVDDVSFNVFKGETLGLVGESGSGKSTVGRTVLGMYRADFGEVRYSGKNIFALNSKEKKEFHRKAQMIFQDPYASLNPRMTVGDIIAEGMDIHNICTGVERENRIEELLIQVGLNTEHKNRFPHEFSGGQRQRIGIARSLALNPEFIVCDEPISALDVSVQAQVVNLLQQLQEEYKLTYLFIAHDLSMVRYISDRIIVMYHGSIVEAADSDELYTNPLHPYTQSLLSAIPIPDPVVQKRRRRIKFDKMLLNTEGAARPVLREVKTGHFVAI